MPIAILLQSLDTGEQSLCAVLELVPPSEFYSPRNRRENGEHQLPSCVMILRFLWPDSPPVGGFTINSPAAVLSNLKSGFANARAWNCSLLTRSPIAFGNSIDMVSG